jgi:hypothetical protein
MRSIDQSSLSALLDLIGGDVESLNELIESFVGETDQVLQIQQELERCVLELNHIRSEQISA